jgi:molecular chaperone GrpE
MSEKENEAKKENAEAETEENKNLKQDGESKEIQKTEEDLLKEKNTELNDKLLRALAEIENTRRRAREEMEKTSKYAVSKFALDLIPVLESLNLTMQNAPKEEIEINEKLKNFFKGIEMTQSELKKSFDKQEIKRIYPIHEEFNPDLHQAISKAPSEEKEGTVVDVMQAGYTINDRLLRPALVVVATKKE